MKLAVVGAGSMGAEIAQQAALHVIKVKAGKLGRKVEEGWYRYQ